MPFRLAKLTACRKLRVCIGAMPGCQAEMAGFIEVLAIQGHSAGGHRPITGARCVYFCRNPLASAKQPGHSVRSLEPFMALQPKTRRQLAKMIARRLRPFKVRVASVQRNRDGSWHAITYGSQAALERVQPRLASIVAKLSGLYQLSDASNPAASPSAKWLAWARGRRFKRRRTAASERK